MPYVYEYPHPAVTTDCVIFAFDGAHLRVLLIRRGLDPYKGCWALPGGFLRPDESAEEGARRELREETGFDAEYLEQFHTYSAPQRDPRERVITIAFLALVRPRVVAGGDDADEAQWYVLDQVPSLAFDHDQILRDAIAHLRERIHFEPVGYDLLPETFTMPELQRIYETILGTHFDRRNFAKKMLHSEILDVADDTSRPVLYSFNNQSYNAMKEDGTCFEF